jgi:hypothetical protein
MKNSVIIRKIELFNSQLGNLLNTAQGLRKELERIYSASKLEKVTVPSTPGFLDQQYNYPHLFIQLLKKGPLLGDKILRIYKLSVPPENINIDWTVTSFHPYTKAIKSKSKTEEETKELDEHRKKVFSKFFTEINKDSILQITASPRIWDIVRGGI